MVHTMLSTIGKMLKATVFSFVEDGALSRGAAIAFYTATSIAPVLLIVIAVAGLVYGREAAQNALSAQLAGLMGQQTADVLQAAVASASSTSSSALATLVGLLTLMATASGVFGEMQSALNEIWKTKTRDTSISVFLKARFTSLGLVATLGFLLIVSLAVSAALTAFNDYLNGVFPAGKIVLPALNFLVSFGLLVLLFAAIFKFLPDRQLQWRDVALGALVTAFLFTLGKSLIGWYLGSSAIASSYGAAGGIIIFLLWVYYSVQIFLLGAEFTKAFANRHGSKKKRPINRRKKLVSLRSADR